MDIIGAGLSGLIAAHVWPNAEVFEASAAPTVNHRALLRFRSEAVSKVTGIEFKKVKVRKGIWFEGKFSQPNIQVANLYSRKCLGSVQPDRSIWNIESGDRYVAPEDFYDQLVDNCGSRINFGVNYDFYSPRDPRISTVPLPSLLSLLRMGHLINFERAPILVERFRVEDCNTYQTIYFPDPGHSAYRASITGDLLIVEHATDHSLDPALNQNIYMDDITKAFGLPWHRECCTPLDTVEQKYGKIVPIDDAERKQLLFQLTHEHNIYSLGRFATWRNILLDDVVNDAAVIKMLMRRSFSAYELLKASK